MLTTLVYSHEPTVDSASFADNRKRRRSKKVSESESTSAPPTSTASSKRRKNTSRRNTVTGKILRLWTSCTRGRWIDRQLLGPSFSQVRIATKTPNTEERPSRHIGAAASLPENRASTISSWNWVSILVDHTMDNVFDRFDNNACVSQFGRPVDGQQSAHLDH